MKETKEAVLTLFKVISKSMIDLAPKMGAEYTLKTKVKGKIPSVTLLKNDIFSSSASYFN